MKLMSPGIRGRALREWIGDVTMIVNRWLMLVWGGGVSTVY